MGFKQGKEKEATRLCKTLSCDPDCGLKISTCMKLSDKGGDSVRRNWDLTNILDFRKDISIVWPLWAVLPPQNINHLRLKSVFV